MYKYKELYIIVKKQNQSVSIGDNEQYLKSKLKIKSISSKYVCKYVCTNKQTQLNICTREYMEFGPLFTALCVIVIVHIHISTTVVYVGSVVSKSDSGSISDSDSDSGTASADDDYLMWLREFMDCSPVEFGFNAGGLVYGLQLSTLPKLFGKGPKEEARHAKISEPGIKIINKYQQNTKHRT